MCAHLCVQQTATLHHVFYAAGRLLQSAQFYQDDSTKADHLCEIVTYEGQGHRVFFSNKHYDLALITTATFFINYDWLSKQ